MEDMAEIGFKWPDYVVFGLMLAASAAIGFYYACTGGKQRTTEEYLMADRSMPWFPVAASILASFVSSITMMGKPAEVYSYGTIIVYSQLGVALAVPCVIMEFLPVFSQAKVTSVFTYLELRFGKAISTLGIVLANVLGIFYMSLVIYGPSLAFSIVTGLNLWLCMMSITCVAILYTVLGGMKAVLWADTLQLVLMLGGLLAVMISGMVQLGVGNIWETTKISGRLDFLEGEKVLSFDPRMRHTLWNQLLSGYLYGTAIYAFQQASTQRALTLRSKKDIVKAYTTVGFGHLIFSTASLYIGVMIFTNYKLCDPLANGTLTSKDQLYPYYVLDLYRHQPGLPGFILAAVFSASLSTLSTQLCAVSTLFHYHFVNKFFPSLRNNKAAIAAKVVCFLFGGAAIAFVLLVQRFGRGIHSFAIAVGSLMVGPIMAVFHLGCLIPIANNRGTIAGVLIGIAWSFLVGFGGIFSRPYVYEYPTTTAGCNITNPLELANMSSPVYDPSTWNPQSHYRSGVYALFDVSYAWNGTSGFIVTFVFGVVCSLLKGNKYEALVRKELLSPVIIKYWRFLPQTWKDRIDMSDNEKPEVGECDKKSDIQQEENF